jgi:hypothetical protein
MSSGLECEFVEPRPGEWFYIPENPACDLDAQAWREEEPTCCGPFETFDEAYSDLHENYGNPGGFHKQPNAYYPYYANDDAVYERLFAAARANRCRPTF